MWKSPLVTIPYISIYWCTKWYVKVTRIAKVSSQLKAKCHMTVMHLSPQEDSVVYSPRLGQQNRSRRLMWLYKLV